MRRHLPTWKKPPLPSSLPPPPPPPGMTTQGLELPLGLCPGDKGAGAGRTAWSRRACRLAI